MSHPDPTHDKESTLSEDVTINYESTVPLPKSNDEDYWMEREDLESQRELANAELARERTLE